MLTKTVSTVQAQRMLYKAVSHTVLIYGLESWVVTGVILKVLGGVPSSSGPEDLINDRSDYGEQGVVVSPSG